MGYKAIERNFHLRVGCRVFNQQNTGAIGKSVRPRRASEGRGHISENEPLRSICSEPPIVEESARYNHEMSEKNPQPSDPLRLNPEPVPKPQPEPAPPDTDKTDKKKRPKRKKRG